MRMSVTPLCVLLVVASWAQYGSATLHELAGFMPHTRVLRQVSQSEVKRCSNVFLQEQCSTTSYAQDLINRLSQCGTTGSAAIPGLEGACRKNPSTGDYCGSLIYENGNALQAIPRSCTISTCSTSCRTQLNSVINSAGCCATSYAVISVILSPYLSSCSLTLPAACPASSLRIPSSSSGSCTTNDLLEVIFSFRCSRSYIQPALNTLNSANCGEFASAVEADCSYRNGQYCGQQIVQPSTITTITDAVSQCSSSSSCSSGCRTEIRTINNDLGCCINSLNASLRIDTGNTLALYRTITSNELWNACGETPPGECEVRLSAAASLCGSMSAILLLALVVVMLIKF